MAATKRYKGARVRKSYRLALYSLTNGVCVMCGKKPHETEQSINRPNFMTLDHLNNEKADNHWTNLVPCCDYCNKSKGGKSWKSWMPKAAKMRLAAYLATPPDEVKARRKAAKLTLQKEARLAGRSYNNL